MPWAIQTFKNAKRCLNSRILAVEKAKGWPFKWPGLSRAGPSEGQPSLGTAVSEVSLASSQMPALCRAHSTEVPGPIVTFTKDKK